MTKRAYKQFCPAARTLDVVGERWTMLIVRDLMRGPRRYTDLRNGLPGMASNLLAERLSEMESAGLLRREHHTEPNSRDVYVLTERGRELRPLLLALARFGLPYLDMPTEDQPLVRGLIPEALTTLVIPEELPANAFAIDFDLDEGSYAMTIEAEAAPGHRCDATDRVRVDEGGADAPAHLEGSLAVLLWIRRGDLTAEEASDQGLLALAGSTDDVAMVRRMFGFERTVSPPAPRG